MFKILYIITIFFLFADLNADDKVVSMTIDGGIGPGTASYIQDGVDYAEKENATALIIHLNTPGGLLESTRDIVTTLLEAKIPIVVYVSPAGARAGSAGVFITLAANIAIMAPGTNIGAAHPVGIGGQSDTSAMFDKITNDAAAFVRTIAQKRKKNIAWAEDAVRESVSATENESLDMGVIDYIAKNEQEILDLIHKQEVETSIGNKTINSRGAMIDHLEMDWRQKLLTFLSDPNIAYIFILLAMYGIMIELYNPGSIFPGVVGAISAMIAAYSLQMLPVNYAGLGLMILAVILFLIEIKVTSYGMLSIGGIMSFILGSVMLIDSPFEFMSISMSIIITAAVLTALFFILIVAMGIKAQTKKKTGGHDSLNSEIGVALEDISAEAKGKVRVHGEIWTAIALEDIVKGDEIIVVSSEGLLLKVKKN